MYPQWEAKRKVIDQTEKEEPWTKAWHFEIDWKRNQRALYKACLRKDYATIGYLLYTGRITKLDFPCFCNGFLKEGKKHSFLSHLLGMKEFIFYLCRLKKIVVVTTEMFWDALLPNDQVSETFKVFLEQGTELVCCKSLIRLLTLIVDWRSEETADKCWKAIETYRQQIATLVKDTLGVDLAPIVMGYLGSIYQEPEDTEELSSEIRCKYLINFDHRLSHR